MAIALTSCGEEPKVSRSELLELSAEQKARNKAEFEKEKAELASIDYNDCPAVWRDGRVSVCGKERLRISLEYCAKRYGAGYRLDPLSAGDSWIMRAGRRTMQTFDERADQIREGEYLSEPISFASGNNTNAILIVDCDLDSDLRVRRVATRRK